MPKVKKENSPKLYHGTTEIVAKTACSKGLTPYEVDAFDLGNPRNLRASTTRGICLTATYPGLMAFDTASNREKWGIMEIDVAYLYPDFLMPHEVFLAEKVKTKIATEGDRLKKLDQIRQNLSNHHKKWRESLDNYGVCVYEQEIPVTAITKVAIYDPYSNPSMTKAMLSGFLGTKFHKSNLDRQGMIIRWLLGENITPEEWLGNETYSKLPHFERDRVGQVLRNKHGLDIFYSGGANGKKATWW